MQAGKLRHRITIQHSTANLETPGSDGTVTPAWAALHANISAEVLAVSGGETLRGGVQIAATTTHVIRIRYIASLVTTAITANTLRITWGSTALGITHIRDTDGRRRELLIEATAS